MKSLLRDSSLLETLACRVDHLYDVLDGDLIALKKLLMDQFGLSNVQCYLLTEHLEPLIV